MVEPSGQPSAFRRGAVVAVLALGASVTVVMTGHAQIPDTTRPRVLPPVTVTETRDKAIPPPVSVIVADSAVVRRVQAANAYDLVRRATGIEVHEQGQGPGYASNAVIRGFTSDHSSDVLLTIDGVPINLPIHGHVEGYADWSLLSAPALLSLRVLHGPASPLYGDFAFGGVVEATTQTDGAGTTGAAFGSTEGDAGGWLRTGRASESGGHLTSFEGRRDQGWREHADAWLGTGVLRGWRRAGAGRVEGGLLLYGSRWNSPGFASVEQYNADDLEGAQDTTDGGEAWRVILHGRYGLPLGERSSLQMVAWTQVVRQRVFLTIPEDGLLRQSGEHDRRIGLGGQAQWSRRETLGGELTLGVDGRGDAARYDRGESDARVSVDPEIADDGTYLAAGAFGRWRRLVGSRLLLDVGGRVDGLRYGSLDRLNGGGWRHGTSVQAGPKLGARWLVGGSTSLLASVSRGFRGAPGVVTDPTRHPMVVWAGELGLAVERERVRAHLATFRLHVAHERLLNPVTLAISEAGRSVRQGLSASIEAAATGHLWLVAEGTFNDARMREVSDTAALLVPAPSASLAAMMRHDEPLEPGDPVPGVARYLGRVGVEYRRSPDGGPESVIAIRSRFVGPFTPIGERSVRTRPYVLVDLDAAIPLGRAGAAIDVDIQNVLNVRYVELRASGYLNPGTPRLFRAAFRLPVSPRPTHHP